MNVEKALKEQREIEAMSKGYMGLEGTFASIAKRLGQPIMRQGSGSFEQTFLEDPFEIHDPEEILSIDEEDNSYEMGVQFDGLSRGLNMTITLMHYLREITCRFEGKIVYKEIASDLEGYAPDPAWEDKIDELFKLSKKIEKQLKPIERQKLIESNAKKRTEIFDYLKKKWGLK